MSRIAGTQTVTYSIQRRLAKNDQIIDIYLRGNTLASPANVIAAQTKSSRCGSDDKRRHGQGTSVLRVCPSCPGFRKATGFSRKPRVKLHPSQTFHPDIWPWSLRRRLLRSEVRCRPQTRQSADRARTGRVPFIKTVFFSCVTPAAGNGMFPGKVPVFDSDSLVCRRQHRPCSFLFCRFINTHNAIHDEDWNASLLLNSSVSSPSWTLPCSACHHFYTDVWSSSLQLYHQIKVTGSNKND